MQSVSIRIEKAHGLEFCRLSSKDWEADVLLTKGADISRAHVTDFGECLLCTKHGLSLFDGRDLQNEPLANYNELYYGGWQDLVPHRSMINGSEIPVAHQNGACISWELRSHSQTNNGTQAVFTSEIPALQLMLEKTITLSDHDSTLCLHDRVLNFGTQSVSFPWTHHIAFGDQAVDPQVKYALPDCQLFDLRDWDGKKPWTSLQKSLRDATDDAFLPYDLTRPPQTRGRLYALLTALEKPQIDICLENRRLRMSFSKEIFPFIRYWAQWDDNMRTVALEPSTSLFNTMQESMEHGMVLTLRPQETVSAFVSITKLEA